MIRYLRSLFLRDAKPPASSPCITAPDPLAIEKERAERWLGVFERFYERQRSWL